MGRCPYKMPTEMSGLVRSIREPELLAIAGLAKQVSKCGLPDFVHLLIQSLACWKHLSRIFGQAARQRQPSQFEAMPRARLSYASAG